MRRGVYGLIAVTMTAITVGCGGGGGGGSSSPTTFTTGSSGGGGTTGSTVTTTGGATAGSAASGTSTTGTTTGTATTGGTQTTGTSGGTEKTYPNGYLRPNAIYFGHYGDMGVVSSVLPNGSGRQNTSGGDPDVLGAVPDPDNASGLIYAKRVNGGYGVYRGTTFNVAASVQLAPPTLDYVSTLQATADGAVIFVAIDGGTSKLCRIADGVTTTIDEANEAAVTLDGSLIAYTKNVGSYADLFVWAKSTGSVTPLNTGGDATLPSFSKDGAKILFSSERAQGGQEAYDLYAVPSGGGTVQRITNTPNVSEMGGCYDETGTKISYVGFSSQSALTGVFVLAKGATTRVATDSDVNLATYWTDSAGRAIGRAYRVRFQALRRKG